MNGTYENFSDKVNEVFQDERKRNSCFGVNPDQSCKSCLKPFRTVSLFSFVPYSYFIAPLFSKPSEGELLKSNGRTNKIKRTPCSHNRRRPCRDLRRAKTRRSRP